MKGRERKERLFAGRRYVGRIIAKQNKADKCDVSLGEDKAKYGRGG